VSRNDVILGIAALALVGFALVVSLVLPRRNPNFPGRHIGALVLVAALLIIAMLTAVEVFGESHVESAAGESGATETEPAATESTPTESTPTETTAPTETSGSATGDPAAGKEIFEATAQPPCGSCHTLAEANASGTVGPDLDQVLEGKDAEFIHESIVEPDAEIASGFSAGIMPDVYGEQLDDQQLADLVAFIEQSVNG
jgi:mono/diheme cytochrome c family protein